LTSAKYSFSWALDVVSKLNDKYPRATDDVKKFLGITDRNLAAFLAYNDEMFPKIRDLIHESDLWMKMHPGIGTTTHLLGKIRMSWRVDLQERAWIALDRVRKSNRLEEQRSRGGA
jgi:hypothetical protein